MVANRRECLTDCNGTPVTTRALTYEGYHGDQMVKAAIEIYRGDVYRQCRPLLRAIDINFHEAIYRIPREQAEREGTQDIKPEGIVFLIRSLGLQSSRADSASNILTAPGQLVSAVAESVAEAPKLPREDINGYIGCIVAQSWNVPWREGVGVIKVLYLTSGAILKQYRRMGLGSKCIEIANVLSQPDFVLLRLRSGGAANSFLKARLPNDEPLIPLEERWNKDDLTATVLEYADTKTWHSNPIDKVTGITEAVYEEGEDKAYQPDPNHPASKIDQQMRDLGLRPERGDGMYFGRKVNSRLPSLITNLQLVDTSGLEPTSQYANV